MDARSTRSSSVPRYDEAAAFAMFVTFSEPDMVRRNSTARF